MTVKAPSRLERWQIWKSTARNDRDAKSKQCAGDTNTGTGDFLHGDLLRVFGASERKGCKCAEWIAKMNAWGPAGCREHLEEIVDHLVEEAAKRNWEMECYPRFSRAVRWAGYLGLANPREWAARWVLKRIVLGAIEKAERAEAERAVEAAVLTPTTAGP